VAQTLALSLFCHNTDQCYMAQMKLDDDKLNLPYISMLAAKGLIPNIEEPTDGIGMCLLPYEITNTKSSDTFPIVGFYNKDDATNGLYFVDNVFAKYPSVGGAKRLLKALKHYYWVWEENQHLQNIGQYESIEQTYFSDKNIQDIDPVMDPNIFCDILHSKGLSQIYLGDDTVDLDIDYNHQVYTNKVHTYGFTKRQFQNIGCNHFRKSGSNIQFAWITGRHHIASAIELFGECGHLYPLKETSSVMGKQANRIVLPKSHTFDNNFITWCNFQRNNKDILSFTDNDIPLNLCLKTSYDDRNNCFVSFD
jgi:hypothetical protein